MPAKTFLFYHLILTTKYRRPTLASPDARACVLGALELQARLRAGRVLAVNHGPDYAHIHALIILPPHYAIAHFIRDTKSQSARLINAAQATTGAPFWARRYFCGTVGAGDLDAARQYVLEQWKL